MHISASPYCWDGDARVVVTDAEMIMARVVASTPPVPPATGACSSKRPLAVWSLYHTRYHMSRYMCPTVAGWPWVCLLPPPPPPPCPLSVCRAVNVCFRTARISGLAMDSTTSPGLLLRLRLRLRCRRPRRSKLEGARRDCERSRRSWTKGTRSEFFVLFSLLLFSSFFS